MNLSPLPVQKFFGNDGRPLNGGLLFTYVSGTTTKVTTYKDSTGGPVNTNPIVLDYRGEANIWLDQTLTYKFVLSPANDTDPPTNPIWTVDNISAGITFASLTQQIIGQLLYPRTAAEIAASVTPTYYYYAPGDLRRYGAVGVSATPDTAAWLAAVAQANQSAASAAEIFIAAGYNFYINTGATATRPIRITGISNLVSLLTAQSDITLLTINGGVAAAGSSIANVGFTGIYTGATSGSGVLFQTGHDCILDGVRITGFAFGLQFSSGSSYQVSCRDCRIEGNTNRNIYTAAGDTNTLNLYNCSLGSSGSNLSPIGISLSDANSLNMYGCSVEGLRGATVIGVDIAGSAAAINVAAVLVGCHFENNANTLGEIRLGAGGFTVRGISILGCLFSNSASGTYGINAVNVNGLVMSGCTFANAFGTANINYGTVLNAFILPSDSVLTTAIQFLPSVQFGLTPSASSPATGNNGTIATANIGESKVTPAGAITGVILEAGTFAGQTCAVLNQSGSSITFAAYATSHVAQGVACVIAATTSRVFVWDSVAAAWY